MNKLSILIYKFLFSFFHTQLCKFMLVGVTNTMLSFTVYIASLFFLCKYDLKYDYMISFILSYVIGILWSFILNKNMVFKQKGINVKALLKSNLSYFFTGIILTYVISYYFITLIGGGKLVAFFCVIIITFPINFLLHKYWVFRN